VAAITEWISSGMPAVDNAPPVQFAKAPPAKKEKTFEESFADVIYIINHPQHCHMTYDQV
jgi:hypothetical protein